MTVFCSPSYRRAGQTTVTKWLPEVRLAVHEFEADDYRKHHNEVWVIPDELRGNMARVRNWLIERAWEEDEQVVCLDDDVAYVGRIEGGIPIPLGPDRFAAFVEEGFEVAADLGVKMWGINLQVDPKFYREYSPLSFLSPILGPFTALLPNPIRYDERLSLNEDYDYWIQHIHKYHKTLRFNNHHYRAGHLTASGGCASYRTFDEEKEQAEVMLAKWGRRVVSYNFERSTNPRIRIPLKGL